MTAAEYALIIGAILTGIAGFITAVTTARSSATKSQLDALTSTVTTLQTENKRLIDRVGHLEQELEERDGTLEQVREWAELLVKQVKSHGDEPVRMPERKRKVA